jgi:hypothetical protein
MVHVARFELSEVTLAAAQWNENRAGRPSCQSPSSAPRPARPGRAREFFENSAAELTSSSDMEVAFSLAARHDVEAMRPGS